MGDWISNVIDAVGMTEASLVGHSQGCLITMECSCSVILIKLNL